MHIVCRRRRRNIPHHDPPIPNRQTPIADLENGRILVSVQIEGIPYPLQAILHALVCQPLVAWPACVVGAHPDHAFPRPLVVDFEGIVGEIEVFVPVHLHV